MKSLFITSLLSVGLAFSALGAADEQSDSKLKLGDAIPAVTAKDQNGQDVNLGQSKTGYTLVYFYPKDETPSCTKQACSFRDYLHELENLRTLIFGVSPDGPKSHQAFIAKPLSLPKPCLARRGMRG